MKTTTAFRRLLKEEGAILAPGCFDCFSAKILERLGFSTLYLTGYGAEAVRLGMPDLGLMTLTEMAEQAGNITNAVSIPLISDIDTGYGGVLNIARTIQAFERAGVAAVHLEDQSSEKKCSLMPGRKIITAREMVMKVKAAVDARTDPDFVIIARSDAKQPVSFEETLRRLHLYLEAGADLVMTAEVLSVEEYEKLGQEFPNRVAIVVGNSKEQGVALPAQEYEKMGIKMLIHPVAALGAAGKAIETVNRILYQKGFIPLDILEEQTFMSNQINEILSLDEYDTFMSEHTVNE